MKIKHLFIGLLLAATTPGIMAQPIKKQYFVSKAGTLISMMTEDEANSVTHLTLTGKINAEDFRHLRDEFKNLEVLDISNAEIKSIQEKPEHIPTNSMYICPTLFLHMHSAR